jgi:thiol-disulfide isomerase/thioredoxin
MNTDNTRPTGTPDYVGANIGNTNRIPKKMSTVIGVAAVAIIALAACSAPAQPGSATSSTTSEGPSSAMTSSVPGSSDNELAPNFQIAVYQGQDVLGGQEVEFLELLGQGKPIILNFWAGLCPPCRLEMPDFQEVYDEYNDEILLVGVDIGTFTGLGTQEDGRALLEELGITYPAGTTSDAEVMRAYQIIGMPTTFFIKPNGEIVQKWTGLLTNDKLAELTEELVGARHSWHQVPQAWSLRLD